jgi:3-phosphoshikimate 1-carboxyvinyltransferase
VKATDASYLTVPGALVTGEIRVPGDKSISHRAAMLGAIAEGTTDIRGFLEAADCEATLAALASLGVRIDRPAPGQVLVHGIGAGGFEAPPAPLDLGNSGTSMRLLTGILAGEPVDATLVGDASLMERPMERVAAPLRHMGADVRTRDGRPPVTIRGSNALVGCDHVLPVPSAQVKSAILLAGLRAKGRTRVQEPGISRDHTERMLEAFGVPVVREPGAVAIHGPVMLQAARIDVPGDFSSAAFFVVAGLIAGAGRLVIRDVGLNPTRTGLLEILRLMGAEIRTHALRELAGEPRGDIELCPAALHGIEVPATLVPAALDELPILFAAAATAAGETVVTGAGELRVKESDRLAAMADGLTALGVAVERLPDGLRIRGGRVSGGEADARGDHRIAMALAVLGARAESPVRILDVQNVATSFPGFVQTARASGLKLEETA